MKRLYENVLRDHFSQNRQAAFLSGPRQVGKTSIALNMARGWDISAYRNWDNPSDQLRFIQGSDYSRLLEGLPISPTTYPLLILDEIHKFSDWKNYIKGLIDTVPDLALLVTGSARLNIYKKGGDSLMGRYFHYRAHPFSIQELVLGGERNFELLQSPSKVDAELVSNLLRFGGFPEPYLRQDQRFYVRWQNMRFQQLVNEDIRSIEAIQNLSSLELLATLLRYQSGQLVNYTNLATKVRVSVPTIQRWINVLEQVYYCFMLRPWHRNIARSLIKEPKVFLYDWSLIEDKGAKLENFVASHLLKAVHYWTDLGLGVFDLYFIRTKDQKEVDFLVTRNDAPWFLCEVKASQSASISKHLIEMQQMLKCPHAFQVVFDMPQNQRITDWLSLGFFKDVPAEAGIIPVESLLSMLA